MPYLQRLRLPKARMTDGTLDFSFSGLKTAVLRYVRENSMPENTYPAPCSTPSRRDPPIRSS
jgi:tRNA A37 threonylcarbamoyltransferase TsaD